MDEFMTSVELAQAWGITAREVRRLAAMNRVDGAVKVANRWFFPLQVAKPGDKRRLRRSTAPPLFWLPKGEW